MIVSYIVCIGSWARVRRLKLVEVKLCKKKFSPKWGMGLFPHRQGTTLHLPLEHSKRHIFQNIEITSKKKWFKMNFFLVKLLFTTICFVDFYSVPNLIVIIFNLLYPVCIVGFHCKGCVIERVVWRLKHLKTKEGFASISQFSIPRSIWCALHALKCEDSGQMETVVSREYLAGKAFLRDTREAFCYASLSSLKHTFCAYTIYTHITHKCEESFWEKTLAKQLES